MGVNDTEKFIPTSGYDLSIYGLQDGSFLTLHILAISCLSTSFACAFVTIFLSFKFQHYTGFFHHWRKGDRFVVYLAICDSIFSSIHLADHLHVLIVKDHVYPKPLCVTYAFIIFSTVTAQNVLVNSIAINVFALMFFGCNLNFGKNDWRLITWVIGPALILACIPTGLGKFGPTGAYCGFDAVTGVTLYLVLVAVPKIVIVLTNTILYLLTWYKIYSQSQEIKASIGRTSSRTRATHKAARTMVMFVAAYIVRWWALAMSGFYAVTNTTVPQVIIQLVVFFSNIGGLLNMLVFIMIHHGRHDGADEHRSASP